MAIAFALFLGYVGVHRFTLGQWYYGLIFIFLFVVSSAAGLYMPGFEGLPWATLAAGVGYYEAYRFWRMSDEEFADRYLETDEEDDDEVDEVKGRYLTGRVAANPRVISSKARRKILIAASDAFANFDYQGAADLYEEALDMELSDGSSRVYAARCYSLLEDEPNAYRHLRRAVQLKAANLELVQSDPGFAWLRTRPNYAERRGAGFAEREKVAALPPSGPNLLDQLEQLGRLRERGLLDDEEFSREKRRLLR